MDERSFQRLLRRTVAIPVALLVLLAIVLVVEILSLTGSLRLVDHTDQVITNARQAMRYMSTWSPAPAVSNSRETQISAALPECQGSTARQHRCLGSIDQ